MDFITKLLCNHRHTVEDHPACFAAGNVNENHAEDLYTRYGVPWYQMEGWKVGYLDIESDGLKVDFSTMLAWCIKEKDGPILSDIVTKKELFEGDTDKRIIQSCIDEMMKYKILVTYNGTWFDMAFLRAKAMHYGLDFPGYVNEVFTNRDGIETSRAIPETYHFDLYFTVKSKLGCMSRRSLDAVCDYLNIEGKTPLKREVWRRAKYGDPQALAEVLEHCQGDVSILEELHDKLTPYQKFTKRAL